MLLLALDQSLAQSIDVDKAHPRAMFILYEILPNAKPDELACKRMLEVVWMGSSNKQEQTYPISLSCISSFAQLTEHLATLLKPSLNRAAKIRFFEISDD